MKAKNLNKTINSVDKLFEGIDCRFEFCKEPEAFEVPFDEIKIHLRDSSNMENAIQLEGCDGFINIINKAFQLGRTAKELELKRSLSTILNMKIEGK